MKNSILISLIFLMLVSKLHAEEAILPSCFPNQNINERFSRAWWIKNAEPKYLRKTLEVINSKTDIQKHVDSFYKEDKISQFDLIPSKNKDTLVLWDFYGAKGYVTHSTYLKRTFITLNNNYKVSQGIINLDQNNNIISIKTASHNSWRLSFIIRGDLKYRMLTPPESIDTYGIREGMELSFLNIENKLSGYEEHQCVNDSQLLFVPITLKEFNDLVNSDKLKDMTGTNPIGQYIFLIEDFKKSFEIQKQEGKPVKEERAPAFLRDKLNELELLDTPKYRAVREIAKKLLQQKIDRKAIIEATGLSEAEINAL